MSELRSSPARAARLARSLICGLALVPIALSATPAAAQTRAPRSAAVPRVEPRVLSAIGGLPQSPMVRTVTDRTIVVIELREPSDLASLMTLDPQHVSVALLDGRPRALGRRVIAEIDREGARSLEQASFVRAVRLSARGGLLPLDRSAELLDVPAARAALPEMGALTGSGVTIADVDSGADPFHPAFFRGDGGWYDWIDVDRDGRFSGGMDAIDLDRDGMADPEERAVLLRAATIHSLGGREAPEARRAGFDPAIDWVYLDVDGDRVRDVGGEAGFDDSTPALAEPTFTPDDVDGDGVIDPEERFVRLGTSKLAAYLVDLSGLGGRTYDYRRGTNLATALRDYTGGSAHGYSDTLHGTGVLGILAGDLPLMHRRWVGIAPDADLVLAFNAGGSSEGALMWALERGGDVVLHEYVWWAATALDGSDELSSIIDESTTGMGVAHICPAGNIGGARHHAEFSLTATETRRVELEMPDAMRYAVLSVHVPATSDATFSLIEPDGTEHALDMSGAPGTLTTGGYFQVEVVTTSRGFRMASILMQSDTALRAGAWTLRATGDADETTRVHGFTGDSQGFAQGLAWPADIATDASTVSWPATADRCTAVGAVPAHTSDEAWWFVYSDEAPGEVRFYSGRGPRIDGTSRLDVVAPDNPWAALGAGDIYPTSPGALVAPDGAYQVFGGTSGAGPHVAGVAALLYQIGVRGDAIRARMRESAIADAVAGTLPNDDYGAGRISAGRALDGPGTGSAPTISLRAEPMSVTTAPGMFRFVATATDADGDAIEVQWDEGYDGTWDGEYESALERTITVSSEGPFHVKVRARDATGRISEAAAVAWVGAPPVIEIDGGTPDAGVGADAGPTEMPGGCGCRATGAGESPLGALALALFALIVAHRRRRRM